MRIFLLPTLFSALSVVSALTAPREDPPKSCPEYPDLLDADLETLVIGLERGRFTSQDLVAAYLARIEMSNPTLHAVTEINPDAMEIAARADSLRGNGTVLSPLHGIPILIKNNIATDDKMNNTAGSYALLGSEVPRDSTVAHKLRKSGAVILGKTNLSQWAFFRSLSTSNGWSAYGGQTEGAYYPEQDPSGSSSGSGVATSIGLALASLGTETSGSIISPAGVNNLVAIKPTVGLTSRHLVIPISERQDTVGPMARTVKDAAYVLQAIAGRDSYDNYTSAIPNGGCIPDYVAACDSDALSGKRIGIPRNVLESSDLDAHVLSTFNTAVQQMVDAGAIIVDANFTEFDAFVASNEKLGPSTILAIDFVSNLPTYLAELTANPYNISDLSDLRDFTQSFPAEDYPERDTFVWDSALSLGYDNTDPLFWPQYQTLLAIASEGGILGALDRNNVSAVLLPSEISPQIPAIVGSPVVTVPLGFAPQDTAVERTDFDNLVFQAPGLPFGISFLGPLWSEAELVGLAYAYEQLTMHRLEQKPYLVPNIGLEDVVA